MIDDLGGEDFDAIVISELLSLRCYFNIKGKDGGIFFLFEVTSDGFHSFQDVLFVDWSNIDCCNWNLHGL